MFPLVSFSKTQYVVAFAALVALRVVVGFHFFMEGTDKLKSGQFTAEPFLNAAVGPAAPWAKQMLDDPDGQMRLCLVELRDDDGNAKTDPQGYPQFDLDPSLPLALWDDFIDRARRYYAYQDPGRIERLIRHRQQLADQIHRAREAHDRRVDTAELARQRAALGRTIRALRTQADDAERLLDIHSEELREWLATHRAEVLAWWKGRDRAGGFQRDGAARNRVAVEVASLREQKRTIQSERRQQMRQWTGEVEAIWDSLESGVQRLAVADQAAQPPLELHRPFRQSNSPLQWINQVVPWFDTIVGGLLILGLFTRLASLLGAAFLASIIAMQPPWIPGAASTFPQSIELLALLVIFALGAGRLGGLDFFLSLRRTRNLTETPES